MSDEKYPGVERDVVEKAMSDLDKAMEKARGARGSVADRMDKQEAMLAEVYGHIATLSELIKTQAKTIGNLNVANRGLVEKIENLSVRLARLEAEKIANNPFDIKNVD
jgi:chromosome segregation ATPase